MGTALTVTAVCMWGDYNNYESKWRDGRIQYTDTFKRWGGRHVYRVTHRFTIPQNLQRPKTICHLPRLAVQSRETGKPHGEWKITVWEPFIQLNFTGTVRK